MVMGKRHDQQMSVIGLTKRPEHVAALAFVIENNRRKANHSFFIGFSPLIEFLQSLKAYLLGSQQLAHV
jgi:hypothetical protein